LQNLLLQQFLLFGVLLCAWVAEIEVLVNVATVAGLFLDLHISDICVTFELIVHVISIIVTKAATIITNLWFFKLESILQTYLTQFGEHNADTITKALFKLIWRHIKFDTKLLHF